MHGSKPFEFMGKIIINCPNPIEVALSKDHLGLESSSAGLRTLGIVVKMIAHHWLWSLAMF